MKRGRWLESAAIKGLKEEHPDWLITQPNVFLADTERRIGATPDALVTRPQSGGIVNCQIKCVGPLSFERYWADGVPKAYALQTRMEGMLLGAESNLLCVLVSDSHRAEITLYELPRSPGDEAAIVGMAKDFWQRIEEGQPYEPDFARDSEIVTAMYPEAEAEWRLDLSGDNRLPDVLRWRERRKAYIARASERVKAADTEIKFKLGEHEIGDLPGWKISWKNEFVRAHQVPERNSRVLRIKQLEDNT